MGISFRTSFAAEPIRIVNLKVQKLAAEVREGNAIADIKELERDKLWGSLVDADETDKSILSFAW